MLTASYGLSTGFDNFIGSLIGVHANLVSRYERRPALEVLPAQEKKKSESLTFLEPIYWDGVINGTVASNWENAQ